MKRSISILLVVAILTATARGETTNAPTVRPPQQAACFIIMLSAAAIGSWMIFKVWQACPTPGCLVDLQLQESTDGGKTWVTIDEKEVILDQTPREYFRIPTDRPASMFRVLARRA